MSNHARQLLAALMSNHPVDARAAFESGIRSKVQSALELRKVEVAQGVFNEAKIGNERTLKCSKCGHEWTDYPGSGISLKCPKCDAEGLNEEMYVIKQDDVHIHGKRVKVAYWESHLWHEEDDDAFEAWTEFRQMATHFTDRAKAEATAKRVGGQVVTSTGRAGL